MRGEENEHAKYEWKIVLDALFLLQLRGRSLKLAG